MCLLSRVIDDLDLFQASPSLGGGHGLSLSVRDLLSWAGFMTSSGLLLRPWESYVHGAALVLLDGMGLGAGLSPQSVARLRKECVRALREQVRWRMSYRQGRILANTRAFRVRADVTANRANLQFRKHKICLKFSWGSCGPVDLFSVNMSLLG